MGIGRKTRLLEDTSREDFYSGEPTRLIPISIFYPAKEEAESLYEELYAPKQEMLAEIYGAGREEQIAHLKTVKASFLNDAVPDKQRKCPVLVFSHGLEADRDFYLFLVEPLVKQGYIVVTTGHLYDTDVTLLPDGRIIKMKPGLLEAGSFEERTAQIAARAEDVRFVLDHLEKLSEEEEFAGMLDLDKVGLCGHSLGGMTVLGALDHPLARTAVMLDAALRFLDVEEELRADRFLEKPILNFRQGSISYGDRLRFRIEKTKGNSPEKFMEVVLKEHDSALEDEVYTRKLFRYVKGDPRSFIYLDKTIHMTFCDLFRLVPHKYYKTLVPIEEAHRIIAEVVSAFLRETLLGEGTPYTDLISRAGVPGIHTEQIALS